MKMTYRFKGGRDVLFAIPREQGRKRCLSCDHVIVSGLYDEELGSMFVCRQNICPYEKGNFFMGKCGDEDEEVRLRLLK